MAEPASAFSMAELASVYFKWRCPEYYQGFFSFLFFFPRPFLAGCPGLIPGFFFLIIFSALFQRAAQG
jgi:hypothetical protein